jgi:hypothetical protein
VRDALLATAANGAWAVAMLPEALAFHRATVDVEGAQTRLLRALVDRHAGTAFGRDHDLARVRALPDLPHALPLADYETHRPYVERIAAGEPSVLSADRVRALEPTSGSGGSPKLIPTTDALRRAFARGIAPWIVDLLRGDPRLATGPAYWSISPALQPDARSAGGVPIGFEDDSAYLGAAGATLSRAVLAVPSAVRRLSDPAAFRYVTLLNLLRRQRLRLVSVWSPSFMTILLDALPALAEPLAEDLARGTCRPPGGPELPELALPPAPRRAAALRRALADDPDAAPQRLWPGLRLVSCWTDASAALPAQQLAARLPQARLQGKGLLATEAFVSLPLGAAPAPVLAVRSHVFEFLDPRGGDTTCFAHQLEPGCEYEVVVTSDVLYRYRLGDLVRVEGYYRQAPLLRFLGRAAHQTDVVGEKLHDRHVREALAAAWLEIEVTPCFALLACDVAQRPPAYRLYVEGVDVALQPRLTDLVERHLRGNPNYAYARALGQLGPLAVVPVTDGAATFEAAMAARGQRRGDVKPVALSPHHDWSTWFNGERSASGR